MDALQRLKSTSCQQAVLNLAPQMKETMLPRCQDLARVVEVMNVRISIELDDKLNPQDMQCFEINRLSRTYGAYEMDFRSLALSWPSAKSVRSERAVWLVTVVALFLITPASFRIDLRRSKWQSLQRKRPEPRRI